MKINVTFDRFPVAKAIIGVVLLTAAIAFEQQIVEALASLID